MLRADRAAEATYFKLNNSDTLTLETFEFQKAWHAKAQDFRPLLCALRLV